MTSNKANSGSTGEPAPRKRRRWVRRLLWTLAVLIVIYTIFGFFGVPLLVRTVAMSRLSERLNGRASVQRCTFNPYTLDLVLEGFAITDDAGDRPVGFRRFDGNLQFLATVFQEGYFFRHVQLQQPTIRVERSADGAVNLAELWISSADVDPGEPLREVPRIVVGDLAIADAELVVRDQALAEPFEQTISGIQFSIPTLDTAATWENAHRLSAQLDDGSTLEWQGSFFVDPMSSSGTVSVEGVRLAPFMPYAAGHTAARISDGRLNLTLRYDFAPAARSRRAAVTIEILRLEDVVVALEGDTVVTLPGLEIAQANFDADAQAVTIDRIGLDRATLSLRRDADGTWRLAALVGTGETAPRPATATATEAAAAPAERIDVQAIEFPLVKLQTAIEHLVEDALGPWSVDVTGIAITDAGLTLHDATREPPVELVVTDADVTAGPVRLNTDDAVPYDASFVLADGGTLHLEGDSALDAGRINIRLQAENLDLPQFAPYMALARIIPESRLQSGRLGIDASGTLTRGDDGIIQTEFAGRMSVASLDVSSTTSDDTVAAFNQLDIDDIEVTARQSPQGVQSLLWKGRVDLQEAALQWPVAGGLFADARRLRADINMDIDLTDAEAPAVRIGGRADVLASHVRLPQVNEFDATIDEATLDGIAVDIGARSIQLEALTLAAPALRTNASLLPAGGTEPPPETDAAEARSLADRLASFRSDGPLGYSLRLGQFNVSGGAITVTDTAAQPPVAIAFDSLEIGAASIANDGATTTTLTVSSNIQGTGQASISGTIDPFRADAPFADMTFGVAGLPLKPYDPYAGHFLGYLIESGRVTLTAPVRIDRGVLSGSLDADLSRLHLGEKVASPAAPSAPIKLGLDLVRDPDDHIRAKVDFKGNLDDPKFRLGQVIWDEFMELLLRGATAPFRLLASVFAGSEDVDLSVLGFEPGTDRLAADAVDKVDALGTALAARPALRLAVVGRADEADVEPLRRRLFDERLLERLRRDDASAQSLTPQRRAEAIGLLFAELFPERVREPVPVPPGRLDQGVPPAAMEAAILATIEVGPEALAALAYRRTQRVILALTAEHAVESSRLTAADELSTPPAAAQSGPRADLELY